MDRNEAPTWATRLLPHLRGAELVGRELLVVGLYLAALVAVVWAVVGMVAGFLSLPTVLGAGGVGGAVKWLREHNTKT